MIEKLPRQEEIKTSEEENNLVKAKKQIATKISQAFKDGKLNSEDECEPFCGCYKCYPLGGDVQRLFAKFHHLGCPSLKMLQNIEDLWVILDMK